MPTAAWWVTTASPTSQTAPGALAGSVVGGCGAAAASHGHVPLAPFTQLGVRTFGVLAQGGLDGGAPAPLPTPAVFPPLLLFSYQEKYYFNPGDTGFQVIPTKFAKLGVLICWDQVGGHGGWHRTGAPLGAGEGGPCQPVRCRGAGPPPWPWCLDSRAGCLTAVVPGCGSASLLHR